MIVPSLHASVGSTAVLQTEARKALPSAHLHHRLQLVMDDFFCGLRSGADGRALFSCTPLPELLSGGQKQETVGPCRPIAEKADLRAHRTFSFGV
jgi:hypothetical protein